MQLSDLKKNVGAVVSFRRKSTDWYVQVGVLHEVRGILRMGFRRSATLRSKTDDGGWGQG